ncbi:MAG: hypothetical protein R3194_12405, partial [Limnobacter sp.]|nr:hypothetical protein [Limnobacter sp.]
TTGLSGSATVRVVTTEPQQVPKLAVDSIQMEGIVEQPKGKRPTRYLAQGLVLITDANGQCVPNAVITVRWTGVVTQTAQSNSSCSAVDSGGKKGGGKGNGKNSQPAPSGVGTVFTSPKSDTAGTFSLTVTDVLLNGYQFAPGTQDQNSVTVP